MSFTVKEVSKITDVTPYTLRFYEKEGVLPYVKRDKNGFRTYSQGDIEWIECVQVLRSTGLPLKEIKEYVELYQIGDSTLARRKKLMSNQKEKVTKHINKLMKTLELINYKMALYEVQEKKIDKFP
ncbi:MerR family transcriptional regulator [Salipaludibacillus neizhouensis]|uniref:MerR family transcriptional regulator n=1 Tax=Salipaludibacillus neizhouensis TaxID=885475 RepID=A0A3A9K6U6_9BACI|nr:MerR family transcriptional regulator [Salipaludibacillus neizhouensis]RKL66232.1 MerR family transcriptional regulator [Salipaludibacillus neizhouensis]